MQRDGFKLAMIKGDDEAFRVMGGRPFEVGEEIWFTMKRKESDTEHVLQKSFTEWDEEGAVLIQLDPEDTNDVAVGVYLYEIKLISPISGVKTLIPMIDRATGARNTLAVGWSAK